MRTSTTTARAALLALGCAAFAAGCAHAPRHSRGGSETGEASYYGAEFEGRRTASGERYRGDSYTCAHRTVPFGTHLRVTDLDTGRSVEVVVTDRGPFVAGRIADLSLAAARRIGMVDDGVVEATLEVLKPASPR